jgi:arabinofuranan 3-O-arabinosyltransferase
MRFTYGWCLMLIVVFCVLYFRYLDAKADGRLDDGIDPPWMKDVAKTPQPTTA